MEELLRPILEEGESKAFSQLFEDELQRVHKFYLAKVRTHGCKEPRARELEARSPGPVPAHLVWPGPPWVGRQATCAPGSASAAQVQAGEPVQGEQHQCTVGQAEVAAYALRRAPHLDRPAVQERELFNVLDDIIKHAKYEEASERSASSGAHPSGNSPAGCAAC